MDRAVSCGGMNAALCAAIHDLDIEEPSWVGALFAEGRPVLDEGLGFFAYSYRIHRDGRIELGTLAGCETAPGFWETLASWGARNETALARIYETTAGSLERSREAAKRAGVPLTDPRERFEAHGVADVLTVVGHDVNGFGVFLTSPRRAIGSAPAERRMLERLAAMLGAAARLREHRRRIHTTQLSAAEDLVARRLVEGASDKVIARELGVALSTVSTFTRRVRRKLGCRPGEEVLLLSATSNLPRRLALFDRLTSAECDVASELLVGSSYADIAERRGVSVRTVASQCTAVFRKCGVSGRRELASVLLGR